ncbi:hypothetical protein GF385_01770 [Candidatus Dependentiae bacterium]|nr:hypothetical protein [Candidatus Dependentiae bacterium]
MFDSNMLEILSELAILFPALLVIFTSRGFFKSLAAKIVGDDTAYENGFLTLNPLIHIDVIGLIIMLTIVFFVGGLLSGYVPIYFLFIFVILLGARWVIPVPINEHNFKNYSLGVLITTIAGPLGCFLTSLFFLYIAAYFPINLVPKYVSSSVLIVIRTIIEFSLFFGVLDLIPIPPFDGGRLLRVVLPLKFHGVVDWLERYSLFIFLTIFFLPGLRNYFFGIIYLIAFFIKQFLMSLVF